MKPFDRLPALPLIANDPYFSVWLPADKPTDTNTVHWTGASKALRGTLVVDGTRYRFLGRNGVRAAETLDVRVTPTKTCFVMQAGPVQLDVTFWTPALPDDLDTLTTPITFVDFAIASTDGQAHDALLSFNVSDELCYDGASRPQMISDAYTMDGLNIAYAGRAQQNVLGHSGDLITIDWGYLYMASAQKVDDLCMRWDVKATAQKQSAYVLLAYEDIASINYFGVPCRAWYARHGKTIMDAILEFNDKHDALLKQCEALDARVLGDAVKVGGEDYRLIVAASWRHTFAAHKIIATPDGELAMLSKENNSNGCIGTVDVSYPSTPMLLRYCPELVNALCRPVLEFASMPVWDKDFAPHDVGRYPYATGQVYAAKKHMPCGSVHPPYYLYSAQADVYNDRYQMPVEECGNMLVMMWAAIDFGASDDLAQSYMDMLRKWVRYLDEYGEDPGEQLCTDDFAGHLAHNVNLSAKALVGMACYAKLLEHFGETEEAKRWMDRAREMARSWLDRTAGDAHTPLTFDGIGWSMKYNLAWDLVFDLGLMPKELYKRETESYLPRMNEYGLPLDSRADYTKSDWFAWCAAMAQDEDTRKKLLAPLAKYLRESKTRVPFSDWYDTKSGNYVEFIARSVQGGVFMPMLTALERK